VDVEDTGRIGGTLDGGHLLVAVGIKSGDGLVDLGGGHSSSSIALPVVAGASISGVGVYGGSSVVGRRVGIIGTVTIIGPVVTIIGPGVIAGVVLTRCRVLAETAFKVHAVIRERSF